VRRIKITMALACQLCPQLRVYCRIAVCEVVGQQRKWAVSFDHLVGGRVTSAGRLRGLEVDDQLDSRGLLDGQIARPLALENAAEIGSAMGTRNARPAPHETAGINDLARGRSLAPHGGLTGGDWRPPVRTILEGKSTTLISV
jgi:hypothetical protein